MHKRTKACAISKKTKLRVYARDQGCCIFCGRPGLPEAHIVPRSHGGLGCEENIITACRDCHDKLDNTTSRKEMIKTAATYLRRFYPYWNENDYIFEKWHKDKAKEHIKAQKDSIYEVSDGLKKEKPQKDKGEPPEGFYFLGDDNE